MIHSLLLVKVGMIREPSSVSWADNTCVQEDHNGEIDLLHDLFAHIVLFSSLRPFWTSHRDCIAKNVSVYVTGFHVHGRAKRWGQGVDGGQALLLANISPGGTSRQNTQGSLRG